MPYGARDVERRTPEAPKDEGLGRTPFQRDRARVLHSAALRRLAAKTQVVGVGESDFPRTRLTHSLECAQIGREMGAVLGADPDVVDAACLAHDLGHPPFGHNGETALAHLAEGCGGFEGNAQSFRVLTRLEAKIEGAGLNLTRATLDAATKYPWGRERDPRKFGVYEDDAETLRWVRDGAGDALCFEAQVMDWADDVAYSVHDLEDGVDAMHVPLERLDVDAVAEVAARDYGCSGGAGLLTALLRQPQWLRGFDGRSTAQAGLKRMTSWLTGRLSSAAVHATRAAYGEGPLVRYGGSLVVPEEARAECALLKAVAAHYVMSRRLAVQERQRELLAELAVAVGARAPDSLEPWVREQWAVAVDDRARLRLVVDQVASLTDTSALAWHARLVRG